MKGCKDGWRNRVHVLPVSFPSAQHRVWQRVGAKRPQLKVEDSWSRSRSPTLQPCKEAGRPGPALRKGRSQELPPVSAPKGHEPTCPAFGLQPSRRTALHQGTQPGKAGGKASQEALRSEMLHFT